MIYLHRGYFSNGLRNQHLLFLPHLMVQWKMDVSPRWSFPFIEQGSFPLNHDYGRRVSRCPWNAIPSQDIRPYLWDYWGTNDVEQPLISQVGVPLGPVYLLVDADPVAAYRACIVCRVAARDMGKWKEGPKPSSAETSFQKEHVCG